MNKPFRTGFMFGLGLFLARIVVVEVDAYAFNKNHYRDRIKHEIQRIKKATTQSSDFPIDQNGRKRVMGFTVE